MLEAKVDAQRAAILGLLDAVDEEQARARLVPSLTTVLGLVKHATFVERVWFEHRIAGRSRHEIGIPETVDESFLLAEEDTIDSVRASYQRACQTSRDIARDHDFDEEFHWRHGPVNIRYIYGHLVAELARHAGHGDILVEQLRSQ